MTIDITRQDREELIQRYYDGETIGREVEAAEQLLESDPAARKLLQSLQQISKSISLDVTQALESEDFSSYWESIQERLPDSPPSLESAADVVVGRPAPVLAGTAAPWFRRLFTPAFGGLALAALVAVAVIPNLGPAPTDLGPLSYAVDVVEVESEGPMVIVQEATETAPSIVSFTES